ncbi:hypothetical protein SHI21_07585 [Bacteriovorax sp. PP10]|uniref:Lipoprotein n=1 Tax=Bacteriovorax antarcticus TaxID=3088717 RepID=A0ABU5VST2_9BACT|nr:hypothetical protein [Bacteriovorax sp. PP10]MEA9356056.1 hypothetical protein [Bacteriovorax sp. PP10]
MKKNLTLLTTLAAALIISSCAHNKATEQKVENEIKEVPSSQTKSITGTIKEQIAASSLSAEQKEKLMALEEKAHAEHTALTDELERTKVVMIQTVLEPKMSQKEFNILKNKITALDKKRLANGFRNAAEVRKIIAPTATTQDKMIYKAVIENRLRGF